MPPAPEPALRYPGTRAETVTTTLGGITFDDPYRWLEEDSDEALEWERAQNALAEHHLRRWPGYEPLREAIAPHVAEMVTFAPRRAGEHWFTLTPARHGLVLRVASELGAPGRILVDPATFASDRGSLDWFYPSPDGSRVAFGVSEGGREQSVLHVIETDSGRVLPERIPHASFARVAWLPDSSGFYYSAGLAPDHESPDKSVFLHRLGEAAPTKPEPVPVRTWYVQPQISPDGRYVVVLPRSGSDPRPTYLKDRAKGDRWLPFLDEQEGVFIGVFAGDRYIAVTTDGAPRGRLVSIPLVSRPERSTWRELVPESKAVLRSVSLAGDKLVLAEIVDVHSRLRILSLDGTAEEEVELPGRGTANLSTTWWGQFVMDPMVASDDGGFTFTYATFTSSPAVHRYDLCSRRLRCIKAPRFELSGVDVEQLSCTASDGAPLSAWLIRRDDAPRPGPTLIYAYGGWNVALLPSYLGALAPFVEAGGSMVFANLRGGGEHGWDWWQAGRRAKKQRTFDDLYEVAETLVERGIASKDRLAVAGASNGGLLAAVAGTQRPDLFRAVVSQVPIVEMMAYTRDAFAAGLSEEYGDPRLPEEAPWAYAYSPYHNASDGTRYPATLFVFGGEDIRCLPWQGRKTVARLQHATACDAPILLRVWPGAGHGAGLLAGPDESAEWVGFLMHQLGMTP